MRIDIDDLNKAIEYVRALKCKPCQIGIYNTTDYIQELDIETINLCLCNTNLLVILSITFIMINNGINQACLLHNCFYSGDII